MPTSAVACPAELLKEIRAFPMFAPVEDPLWETASLQMRTAHYKHGDKICDEGDAAAHVYVVLRGAVDISAKGTFLVTRREREVIGEQALIQGIPRGATMTAAGAVQLLVIPGSVFRSLVGESAFAWTLLDALSVKLSQATKDRARRFAHEELLFGEFRAHLSSAVLNALLSDPTDYAAPRSIDGVVLFSDIRDFSNRSCGLSPTAVAEQVGKYLNHAVDVVHEYGGMVEKFVGDAIVAIWGWPEEKGDADVAAAFGCAKELAKTAGQFTFGGQPIKIGVGLNAGPMFIGNVGSDDKRQFTVLGEVVNLAARFESMCKTLQAPVVVSESIAARLPEEVRPRLTEHLDQQAKGSGSQTVYSCDPASTAITNERQRG